MNKELKYRTYLEKYKNCPKECTEKDLTAFRWVHSIPNENDFLPVNLHPLIAPRIIDNSDLMCTSYGLSLFKDLKSAIAKYNSDYGNRDRESKRQKFITDKGRCVSEITITKNDGVSDEPGSNGHFNFFEYVECSLLQTATEIIDIFTYNETVEKK